MGEKIDKQECARLVVEACTLTRFVSINHTQRSFVDTLDGRAFLVCYKAWQRFRRRLNALDTILATQGVENDKIYVGKCDEDTPPGGLYFLTTDAKHTIYFDMSEFRNR